MNKVIFYTIDCPQCKMLEMQLKKKNIQYEECKDVEEMMSLGIKHAPSLGVDGEIKNLKEALAWVKQQ